MAIAAERTAQDSPAYSAAIAASAEAPALVLNNVTIGYRQAGRWFDAVREVSLTLQPGQTYGLVGESGSGKSTLALAALRYLPPNGQVRAGAIQLAGQNLLALDDAALRHVWAKRIKLVPQNALSSLNPSLRIGDQLAEGLLPIGPGNGPDNGSGNTNGKATDQTRVLELLRTVRLADPERVAQSYPHQLSGGMQQRVMIALALAAEPDVLVLDEPTTALDVTTEAAILDLVSDLIAAQRTAVLFVSHNLGVIARVCDRVAVLYAGELVEDAAVRDLFAQPLHPYTHGLLNSLPRIGQTKHDQPLMPIPGSIPHLDEMPTGCIFAPRCPIAQDRCFTTRPALETPRPGHSVRCHRWPEILAGEVEIVPPAASLPPKPIEPDGEARKVLILDEVEKQFPLPRTLGEMLQRVPVRTVAAVAGVNLFLRPGQTVGLVGESGSGKTTLARCVIGLEAATGGEMTLLDLPLARRLEKRDAPVLRHLQMVFQNPDEALNPYLTVADTLRRPLQRLTGMSRKESDARVGNLLAMVKLRPDYAQRLPGQLSGGEKQRVAIARAFAAQPDLLIFDEAVSALDVSVQASILNLLTELQTLHGSAYLFITHDLAVVSHLADVVAVIYLGQLMEVASTHELLIPPYHPYTEALLSAIPVPDPDAPRAPIRLDGEMPSPTEVTTGCPFHTRCPRVLGEICVTQTPPWQTSPQGQRIFCHIPVDELLALQQTPPAAQ